MMLTTARRLGSLSSCISELVAEGIGTRSAPYDAFRTVTALEEAQILVVDVWTDPAAP